MPDIREILNALHIDDRALWSEQRTIMRRSYLNAHNSTVGMGNWSHEDDAFLDLIDIRLALLFDRAGLLETTKPIVDTEQQEKIEQEIKDKEDELKKEHAEQYAQMVGRVNRSTDKEINEADITTASKLLNEGFASAWPKGNA